MVTILSALFIKFHQNFIRKLNSLDFHSEMVSVFRGEILEMVTLIHSNGFTGFRWKVSLEMVLVFRGLDDCEIVSLEMVTLVHSIGFTGFSKDFHWISIEGQPRNGLCIQVVGPL